MSLPFSAFYVLMLTAGIVLTIITMVRMYSGKIHIPHWAKVLLSLAMIFMLLITLMGMLPTSTVTVTRDHTSQIITPAVPSETTKASQ